MKPKWEKDDNMGHDKLGSALKSFVALKKPYFRGLSVKFASSFCRCVLLHFLKRVLGDSM